MGRGKEVSEGRIVKILREAEKKEGTIGDLCRKHGISEYTFYRWRRRFGGMSIGEAKKTKDLEKENARLKKLVAERDLEVEAMKELLSKKW